MDDLLIRSGRIIDGQGSPAFEADVAISKGRIREVGRLGAAPATRVIDAHGLFVTPGFVDMHTHSDVQLLADPPLEAKVRQGITTDVIGQDGLSFAPATDPVMDVLRDQLAAWNGAPGNLDFSWRTVDEYLSRFDAGVGINAAYLIPHGTLRMIAVGMDDRPATDAELAEMCRMVDEGMRDGAAGLSTGLTYTPAMFASDDEIVALCETMRPWGGYYCPHHRDYGRFAMQAYADCVRIAERARVGLHLAHCHLSFPCNRGRAPELLASLDRARARGADVSCDAYPYLAGNTYLHAVLPGWMQAGGPSALVERLREPGLRERLRRELEVEGHPAFHNVAIDWTTIVIAGVGEPAHRRWVGRDIASAAKAAGKREIDFVCELLAADALSVSALIFAGHEENVELIVADPHHMGGSDGILIGERPHPRGWGTMPRYFAHYVRERGLVSWEEMVRKLTSAPCARLGLTGRGTIAPGMAADVVCFDPDAIRDTATYEEPVSYPEGIEFVIVNGRLAVDQGRHTGNLAGRSLRPRREA